MARKATVYGPYLQIGTDRTLYTTWRWSEANTEAYNVRWYYDTGDSDGSGTVWFVGKDEKVTRKQDTYNAPSNAIRVRFVVLPISKTYKRGRDEYPYFTSEWSSEQTYSFANKIASPSAPSVNLEKYTLTATIDNVDLDIELIEFQLFKDNSPLTSTGSLKVINQYIQYSWNVDAGSEYKVRCRNLTNGTSEWSDYSSKVLTAPSTPSGFTECSAQTSTSVYLTWNEVKNSESYDIEYATKKEYFDSSNQTTTISVDVTDASPKYIIEGLEGGATYFFRLRAVNSGGKSSWSGISSVVVGTKPGSPTTWSSTTTVIVGEQLILYWVHNSEDGSSQSSAELEIYVNEVKKSSPTITGDTSSYTVNTSVYDEGVRLQWRVRTKGVTDEYSDWSVLRTVDVYAPPTLTLSVTDSSGQPFETLTSFPINIKGTAGPSTQYAIGYHLTVTSTEAYDTVDQLGNTKFVSKGEEVYSRYFDNSSELSVTLTAGDLNLTNNVRYKITCIVSMNSGLTAESYLYFTVAWSDTEYWINGTIYIDKNSYVSAIQPYCTDENDNIIEDVTLSVYRREFDGKFTEIITGVENGINVFVSDPHPSLDYARYRVVAMSKTTGYTDYYDIPAYPVGVTEAVIQWDETWSNFDYSVADTLASPTWAGSMIKLPYNIDISDDVDPDVELVEYIGREHPVSYHGTQLGSTSTWSMEIPKEDKSAIYALRRLQKWMGNAYVREPSGSGYWASVKVSFSIKHRKTVVPVTLNITRVEGGI